MKKILFRQIIVAAVCLGLGWSSVHPVMAQDENSVTVYDLIALINNQRVGYGYPALSANSILMSTAQSTADIMAANSMGWHIGDVSGRVMAAGYGGGATAWATENFAIGPMTIDEIAYIWSDASHQIPVVNGNYQEVGAGIAISPSGAVYYVLQAAYTGGGSGSSVSPTRAAGSSSTAEATYDATEAMAQYISPVQLATPGSDGIIHHEVLYGQSLWSIAIAYNIKIIDILNKNGLSADDQIVYAGQKLVIPSATSSGTSSLATLSTAVTGTPPPPADATVQPDEVQASPPTESGPHAAYTVQVNLRFTGEKSATPQPSKQSLTPAADDDPAADERTGSAPIIPIVMGSIFIIAVGLILFGLFTKRPTP